MGEGVDVVHSPSSDGRPSGRPPPSIPEGDVLSVGASRAAPVLALGLQLIGVNPY